MSRIAYVDGRYVPHGKALIPMDDRGYHFADGVYEVIAYNRHGAFVDAKAHLQRLRASLKYVGISYALSDQSLLIVMHELMRKNRCQEGFLYLQITRGVAPRDHVTARSMRPMVTLFVRPMTFKEVPVPSNVFIEPDERWKRNEIKSISLLGNILAKYQAHQKGGDEAWLVNENGLITEGSSTNAWIVTQEGIIRTHPVAPYILNGIVRQRLLGIAQSLSLPLEEKAFSLEEIQHASEAFLTSSTKGVLPVISINGIKIGTGSMGPITAMLRKAYWNFQNDLRQDN